MRVYARATMFQALQKLTVSCAVAKSGAVWMVRARMLPFLDVGFDGIEDFVEKRPCVRIFVRAFCSRMYGSNYPSARSLTAGHGTHLPPIRESVAALVPHMKRVSHRFSPSSNIPWCETS